MIIAANSGHRALSCATSRGLRYECTRRGSRCGDLAFLSFALLIHEDLFLITYKKSPLSLGRDGWRKVRVRRSTFDRTITHWTDGRRVVG